MKRLGAKAITALVVPKREVAWQILALNTEKAHNLKERSLEVIRMVRGLVGLIEGQGGALRLWGIAAKPAYSKLSRDAQFVMGMYYGIMLALLDVRPGHRVLDDAARRIVQMAAPYAAFPPDIRRDTDELAITRTWFFTRDEMVRAN